jgi:predicted Zn-dependent peptidase
LALQLFAELLGTGSVDVFNPGRLANRSSRLGRVLNTSYAFVDSYSDGGVFGVYAAAEDGNAGSLLSTVNKEVRAAAESLSDEDVSRARNLLQSRFSSLSTSRAVYATELASRGLTARALSDAASSLSRSDIQSAVSSALSSAPIIVARGDVAGLRL